MVGVPPLPPSVERDLRARQRQMAAEGQDVKLTPTFTRASVVAPAATPPNTASAAPPPAAPVTPARADMEVPAGQQLLFETEQRNRASGPTVHFQESINSQGETEKIAVIGEHIAGRMAEMQRENQRFTSEAINQMARFVNETRNTGYVRPTENVVREPRLFDGTNAKEWLLQMRQFFDYKRLDEMSRLQSAPMFLTGSAHTYYYNLLRKNPDRLPLRYADFEQIILNRFSAYKVAETIKRLRTLMYTDSITDITEKFANIISEGDEPPEEELIMLYLSRFPRDIIKRAMKRDFESWVEASEYLRCEYSEEVMRWTKWYQLTPSKFKREVETNPECVRKGWVPTHNNFNKTKLSETKTVKDKDVYVASAYKSTKPTVKTEVNKDADKGKLSGTKLNTVKDEFKCHTCGGTGHKVAQCPSKDPSTRKEGSKCHKCGGKDHWAPSCPTTKPGPTPKTSACCCYHCTQGNEEA